MQLCFVTIKPCTLLKVYIRYKQQFTINGCYGRSKNVKNRIVGDSYNTYGKVYFDLYICLKKVDRVRKSVML